MVQFSNSKGDNDFRIHIEQRILEILRSSNSLPNLKVALNILSDHGIVLSDENLGYVESVFTQIYKERAKSKGYSQDTNIDFEF